jgi:hypothetical protein
VPLIDPGAPGARQFRPRKRTPRKIANVYVPPRELSSPEARAQTPYNARVRRGEAAGPATPPRRAIERGKRNAEWAGRYRKLVHLGVPDTVAVQAASGNTAPLRAWRLKQLRAEHRGAGVRQIKRELEGKGLVTAGLETLAKQVGKVAGYAFTAPDARAPLRGPSPTLKKIEKGEIVPGAAGTLQRAAKDIANAPGQIVPSFYVPIAGGVEAAKGRPQRIEKLWHDLKQTDPIYNTGAAVVTAAAGDTKAASKHWKAAKKAAAEHPGYTILEATGTRGVIGRGVGGGLRTAGRTPGLRATRPGRVAGQLGSTQRAPRTLPGTSLVEHRTHSKDIVRKAVDVYRDRSDAKKAQELRDQAKAEKDPEKAAELKAKARRYDPTMIREGDIRRRVDEHVDMGEQVRRLNRDIVSKTEGKALKGAKQGGPVTSLLTQGIVRPTLKSLNEYLADLKVVHERLSSEPRPSKSKLRANEQLRHDLSEAIDRIKKGKVDLDELHDIARQYAHRSVVAQAGLIARGMLHPEQAERARLTPFAVRELGAHKDQPHLQEQAKLAKRAATRAKGRSRRAQRSHARVRYATPFGPLTKQRHTLLAKSETKVTARKAQAKAARQQAGAAKRLAKENPLLAADKAPLSTDALRALQAAHGDFAPGFVSQAPNARGRKNFYVSSAEPPKASFGRREGGATKEGTFDANPELLREQAIRTQGVQDAFDSFKDLLHEVGQRKKGGQGKLRTFKDRKDANQYALDLNAEGEIEWTPVRINPFGGTKRQRESMIEGARDPEGGLRAALDRTLDPEVAGGSGDWAVIPKAAADQMRQHLRTLDPSDAGLLQRQLNSFFRKTVLATSLPWLLGNVTEASFRTALAKAGPRSWNTGRRVIKTARELDPEGAKRAEARTVGTGHYGFADRHHVHTTMDQLKGDKVRAFVRPLAAFMRHPGPAGVAKVWNGYTQIVFKMVNKAIEQQFQNAMLGKRVREELMTPGLRKSSQEAIEKGARGILDPNVAARLGRDIDRMYGRYGKFSPGERRAIALYTPFGAWYRNAAEYVIQTLPRDHPAFVATAAATERLTDEWRKDHGLDFWAPGAVPLFLQGSVPGKDGVHYRAPTRYTPFGAFSDPGGALASQVLPQYSGLLMALRGLDWKGDPLPKSKDGSAGVDQQALAAVNSILQATVPVLSLGERIHTKGAHKAILDAAIGRTDPPKARGSSKGPSEGFGSGFGSGGFSSGFSSSGF